MVTAAPTPSFSRHHIRKGITLFHHTSEKWTTEVVKLVFAANLDDYVAERALAAYLLRHGHEGLRGMERVAAHFQDLYGAGLSSYVAKTTGRHLLTLRGSVVSTRFLPRRRDTLASLLDFLSELLNRPFLASSSFDTGVFEREKGNLLRAIDSIADNKAQYAEQRLYEEMFRGHVLATPSFGFRADVEAVTHERVADACRKAIAESPLLVYVVSPRTGREVRDLLKDRLELGPREPIGAARGRAPAVRARTHRIRETEDLSQARIAMGFRLDGYRRDRDSYPAGLGDTVLGGGSMSRLFKHIRERHSLAYSVGSSFDPGSGTLLVTAGVDSKHIDRVVGMVKRQVGAVAGGRVKPAELQVALAAIAQSLDSSRDSQDAIIGLHLGAALGARAEGDAPALMRRYAGVKPESMARVFGRLRLDTVFALQEAE